MIAQRIDRDRLRSNMRDALVGLDGAVTEVEQALSTSLRRHEITRAAVNDLAGDIQGCLEAGESPDGATVQGWWTRLLRIAQEA